MPQKWYYFGKSGLIFKLNHINIQNVILSERFISRMGEWEMGALFWRLSDNRGELAYMYSM